VSRKGDKPSPPKRAPKRRRGLPAPDHVVSETTLVSPKGRSYRVLKTTETDADEPGENEGEDGPKAARSSIQLAA
jgi:hypothetical protein